MFRSIEPVELMRPDPLVDFHVYLERSTNALIGIDVHVKLFDGQSKPHANTLRTRIPRNRTVVLEK